MPRATREHYIKVLHIAAAVIVICLFAMTVMLMCIVFTPHFPSFEVTSLTVSSLPINITEKQKKNVTFNFQGLLENPNFLLALWYKKLHLNLWFNNSSIASVPLDPPPLTNGVLTNIPFQVKFAVDSGQLPSGVVMEMAAQRRVHGSLDFGITLFGWIKFKFGGVGSKPHSWFFKCYPLQVAFSPDYSTNNTNDTGMLVAPSQCNAD